MHDPSRLDFAVPCVDTSALLLMHFAGNCTNMSMTDPVWGKSPEYFRTFLQGWEEGDTLTFTVQDDDATSSKIIGMKDLTYQD